ncbi:alpha-ketoacid dehydrogenase subunit beta [Bradyrhizobium sp. STM 3557]|uniref:alpha-ketoacid dehydrogenase subunit beta n=1 Tax=Bradyrhizobium sp. STM 3557 TaxID=578920 RepID=UPI00388FACFA
MTGTTMTVVEAARSTLQTEMRRNADIWVLGEDVRHGGVFGQYRGLVDEFGPERIVDTPIAEAAMVGAAVGAALMGTRPVVETRFSDFALSAVDEIVNQAAKIRYMFGGQGKAPLVVRMPSGLRRGSAAQHSQSLEAWFAHVPGLVVTAPATPTDATGLLLTALRGEDPVMHLEAKELWNFSGDVPEEVVPIPFGIGKVVRSGTDLTIVSWGVALHEAIRAAQELEDRCGVSAEIIDLRTLWPWDEQLVLWSVARTRRLVVVHESVRDVGLGAEIAATVAEKLHETLRSPVRRVASPRIPVGYSPPLEDVYRVQAHKIIQTVASMVAIDPASSPQVPGRLAPTDRY